MRLCSGRHGTCTPPLCSALVMAVQSGLFWLAVYQAAFVVRSVDTSVKVAPVWAYIVLSTCAGGGCMSPAGAGQKECASIKHCTRLQLLEREAPASGQPAERVARPYLYLLCDLRVGNIALAGCGAGAQHMEVDLHVDARGGLG